MTAEPVLIAAFSARALAQSAKRAGFAPLVVDGFGDADLRAAAERFEVLDDVVTRGFRTKPLVSALERLSSKSASAPIGLVLGSGFEDKPRLVSALASRFRLLGCDAVTIRACNDPDVLFATLDRLGIRHPRSMRTPPSAGDGSWISKRIGGSGGRHIRDVGAATLAKPRRYFQQRIDGEKLSIGGVFSASGARILATRQWTSPSVAQPYRYGGAVSTLELDAHLYGLLAAAATAAANALGIVGMASFDFIVADGLPYLIDVNPRPGAAIDVLDDESGYAFASHVLACRGDYVPPARRRLTDARAATVLHADRGEVTIGAVEWPDWSADRPMPGGKIPAGAPLATALASAETSAAAEKLARERAAELSALIYRN